MKVQVLPFSPYPLVAQLVVAPVCSRSVSERQEQEVVSSILTWGTGTLPHSSMAEQAAVNREVASSTLAEAAIYWEVGKQAKPSHFECEV